MRQVFLLLLSLTAIALWSCDDCTDCGVSDDEPRLRVEFHNASNNSNLSVNIDSINGRYSGDIDRIQDTVLNVYALPLDMFAEQSTFYVKTFKSSDTLELSPLYDTLVVNYKLSTRQTIRNRYRFVAREISIEEHSYDSVSLICTFDNCEMDDTVLEIYY